MIGQILPNNNERCYSNFSHTFREVNTPLVFDIDVPMLDTLFVSLVYCVESTVRWFVVREKYCWMAADSADKG
jgi:hypothetical protein